jgi:RNA polymerase sigma factor (sigma-70 family)
MQKPDHTALFRFATHRRDADFRLLAERYLGLIFQTSLRRTGNRQLAEEASQNVLCALAKKASALAKHPDRLPPWLHRAALFESSKAMRSETSHQRRKVLEHPDSIDSTASEESTVWTEILPHLDLALDRLPDSDRTLLLQHYFEQMSFPQIGELQSRPAATVQKQSRRALEKLAKILRGKGFVVTTTALATGFGAECAKGAPAAFLRTATSHALATTTYSTTPLTLFMAMKSKNLIPLALLLAFTPLVIQQLAIARASARLDSLGGFTASRENPSRQPSRNPRIVSSERSGKITIAILSRAHDEARRRGGLKWIAFEDMIAGLAADDAASLISQAITLPESRQKKTELVGYLIRSLETTDPGLGFRALLADSRGWFALTDGLPALAAWGSKEPDAAFENFQELFQNRDINPIGQYGFAWSHPISSMHSTLLGSLIAVGSPHVRDLILMAPEVSRSSIVSSSISAPSRNMGMTDGVAPAKAPGQEFESFMPWIREFVREKDRRGAVEKLVFALEPWEKDAPAVFGAVMDIHGLSPDERRWIGESYAFQRINIYYSTRPRPDFEALERSTREWLEIHLPDEAGEVLAQVKTKAHEREMSSAKRKLEQIRDDAEMNDSNLLQELTRYAYGELLPQALEQAARIKDPEKRAEAGSTFFPINISQVPRYLKWLSNLWSSW